MALQTPGIVGRAIRLVLAVGVLAMGQGLVRNAAGFWDGITWSMHVFPFVAVVVVFSSWVIGELAGKPWGWRPLGVLLLGAAAAAGVAWLMSGDLWGPAFGIYLWAWSMAFVLLLAPALLLAAILATPGCEMRSYAHLWTRLRGGDPKAVTCPGWIDRCDGIRIFGH